MSQEDHQPRERERPPKNRTTPGFRLSDELWVGLQPLLPVQANTHRCGAGRPRVPERAGADAIGSVLRTGCQWQAFDQSEWCAHATAHDRFHVWLEAGVFLRLWQTGVQPCDARCGIEWDGLAVDGAMTKAPLGGEKNQATPPDRGQSGVKRSLLTAGHGVPIGLEGEGANRQEMKRVRAPVAHLVVERPESTQEQRQGMGLNAGDDEEEVDAM